MAAIRRMPPRQRILIVLLVLGLGLLLYAILARLSQSVISPSDLGPIAQELQPPDEEADSVESTDTAEPTTLEATLPITDTLSSDVIATPEIEQSEETPTATPVLQATDTPPPEPRPTPTDPSTATPPPTMTPTQAEVDSRPVAGSGGGGAEPSPTSTSTPAQLPAINTPTPVPPTPTATNTPTRPPASPTPPSLPANPTPTATMMVNLPVTGGTSSRPFDLSSLILAMLGISLLSLFFIGATRKRL